MWMHALGGWRLELLVAMGGVVAGGCAAVGKRPEGGRDAPAVYARPEPDPSCRGTVQAPLVANGLEQVTVKVAVSAEGKLTLVEFLSPDLTPVAKLELRRAFEECLWKPTVGATGQPEAWTTTFVRARQ